MSTCHILHLSHNCAESIKLRLNIKLEMTKNARKATELKIQPEGLKIHQKNTPEWLGKQTSKQKID